MSAIDASTLSTTSFVTCMSGMEKWDFTWSCWGAGWGPGSGCPEHVGGVSGRSVAGSAGGGSARHHHREIELPAGAPWLLIPATQTWILSEILHPECFFYDLMLTKGPMDFFHIPVVQEPAAEQDTWQSVRPGGLKLEPWERERDAAILVHIIVSSTKTVKNDKIK